MKLHPIWVDANTTLPRSGEILMLSSGLIDLTIQQVRYQLLRSRPWRYPNSRDDGVDLLDRVLDLEERLGRRQSKLKNQPVHLVQYQHDR